MAQNAEMKCDYIGVTGYMRGCKAADCDKYEKGKREVPRWDGNGEW